MCALVNFASVLWQLTQSAGTSALSRRVAPAELCLRCLVGSPERAPEANDLELVDDSLAGPVMIDCSGCGRPIAVDLDVERAVLERLVRRGREIDRQVHVLASAYHWSLAEIESLGDERRETLAELIAEAS